MENVDVLLGLQWGDEGKGKVVDVLTPQYDIIARFQGGPNAGHTLEFEGEKYVVRSVPSGIFQGNKTNLIGNGVVLDPVLFRKEVEDLKKSGHNPRERLRISRKAHLILPTLRMLDAANENRRGDRKIGTTGRGIGPTYTEKVARQGIRVGDIESPSFKDQYNKVRENHLQRLKDLGYEVKNLEANEAEFFEAIEYLKGFTLVDSEYVVNDALRSDRKVLAEGAQGSLLDIDFGSYPFVTSSNTIAAGASIGLGVAPRHIGKVYGIFKAYCTRVGEGPFPTELTDKTGKLLAERGHEFGAVTGRPRRCGWLDLVALRYSIMLNGVTDLIITKSDVLDTLAEIKVCRAYKVNGEETDQVPYSMEEKIEPIYDTLTGWKTDLTAIKSEEEFPEAFRLYIDYLEKALQTPITVVSVGPDRSQTIFRG